MKFLDLSQQNSRLHDEVMNALENVVKHGRFVMGPEIDQVEKELAAFVGVGSCSCVSNGTVALLIAMLAVGVKPGDEVIVPDFTFFAPAEMIMLLGAKPVPVDIDPITYNIDPKSLEESISSKTKAIVAVSLFGQCADFDAINKIAAANKIPVIEDAAQSFGSTQNGTKSCAFTTVACTSFFPAKPLGAFGDGGAVFTNDAEIGAKIKAIRQHGEVTRYSHELLGINGRMSSFQAAVLSVKLKYFAEDINKRQALAAMYDKALADIIDTPIVMENNVSVYAQYTIQLDNRSEVIDKLAAMEIPTSVHYPLPIHKQIIFRELNGTDVVCPNSAYAASRVLSLPFGVDMKHQDVDTVAKALHSILRK